MCVCNGGCVDAPGSHGGKGYGCFAGAGVLPPTLEPVVKAVHNLVKMVPPPPPSPPPPITVSKKRSYSLLTQVADAAYSLLSRSR